MIASIQGTLAQAAPLRVVIELNGIGYEVHIPLTTAERLPRPGSQAKLHTLAIYREDAQTLYGFAAPEERDFFRLMIENVTGIGPKLGLVIMSRLSLPVLEGAIRSGDTGLLSKCPGIGRKTAERLIVELRSKLGASAGQPGAAVPSAEPGAEAGNSQRDAVAALVALGYKAADADKSVRQAALALGPDADTEQLIKKALE